MYTSLGTFSLLLLKLTNSWSQMWCYSGLEVMEHQSNVEKVENFTLVNSASMSCRSSLTGCIQQRRDSAGSESHS